MSSKHKDRPRYPRRPRGAQAAIFFAPDPKEPGKLQMELKFFPALKNGKMNPVQAAALRCLTQFATSKS